MLETLTEKWKIEGCKEKYGTWSLIRGLSLEALTVAYMML